MNQWSSNGSLHSLLNPGQPKCITNISTIEGLTFRPWKKRGNWRPSGQFYFQTPRGSFRGFTAYPRPQTTIIIIIINYYYYYYLDDFFPGSWIAIVEISHITLQIIFWACQVSLICKIHCLSLCYRVIELINFAVCSRPSANYKWYTHSVAFSGHPWHGLVNCFLFLYVIYKGSVCPWTFFQNIESNMLPF